METKGLIAWLVPMLKVVCVHSKWMSLQEKFKMPNCKVYCKQLLVKDTVTCFGRHQLLAVKKTVGCQTPLNSYSRTAPITMSKASMVRMVGAWSCRW